MNKIIEKIFQSRNYDSEFIENLNRQYIREPLAHQDQFFDLLNRNKNSRFLIIPDFDTDGILSGMIAWAGLNDLGFHADIYSPDCSKYGISPDEIEWIANSDHKPNIIITTDVGISAFEACDKAHELGIQFAITDHHPPVSDPENEFSFYLPNADCIVDPYLPDDPRSFKKICGAQVIQHLLSDYAELYNPSASYSMEALTALSGIACISDMMDVLEENRNEIRYAMQINTLLSSMPSWNVFGYLAKNTQTVLDGLHTILNWISSEKSIRNMRDEEFAFYVAPLLNIIKRTGAEKNLDSSLLYGIFMNENREENMQILADAYNEYKESKKAWLETIANQENPLAPFIYFTEAPAGYLGMIANDFMEKTGLPTIVLNENTNSGSLRSPSWYPAKDRINGRFGNICAGHLLACGIHPENPKDLYLFLHEDFPSFMPDPDTLQDDSDIEIIYETDVPESEKRIDFNYSEVKDYIRQIDAWRPFGKGFPMPKIRLRCNLNLLKKSVFGTDKNHVKFSSPDFDLIFWNQADLFKGKTYDENMVMTGKFTLNENGNYAVLQYEGTAS